MTQDSHSRQPILEWIGVYDAQGGVIGELAYFLGSIFAGRACSLCDITHGWIREKPHFKTRKSQLDVPMRLLHLNEQSSALAAFTRAHAPCVVGRHADGFAMVLTARELAELDGGVDAFFERLSQWQEQYASRPARP